MFRVRHMRKLPNAADFAGSMARKVVDALPNYASDLVGPSTLTEASWASGLQPYALLILRIVLVGFHQPCFQCTPTTMSATWFTTNKMASATATALNFNQIGIAVAFLVGGHMMRSKLGIHNYLGLITLLCGVMMLSTMHQLEDRLPSLLAYNEIKKLPEVREEIV
jgi:hypothetical protein